MFKKPNKEDLLKKLPDSVRNTIEKLTNAGSEQEREDYLKSLPEKQLKELYKASVFVLLKLDEKSKGTLSKLNIAPDIKKQLDEIKQSIHDKGEEIKKNTVDAAVDAMWITIGVSCVIASIICGILLITNPAMGAGFMVVFLFAQFFDFGTMFSADKIIERVGKRMDKKRNKEKNEE